MDNTTIQHFGKKSNSNLSYIIDVVYKSLNDFDFRISKNVVKYVQKQKRNPGEKSKKRIVKICFAERRGKEQHRLQTIAVQMKSFYEGGNGRERTFCITTRSVSVKVV